MLHAAEDGQDLFNSAEVTAGAAALRDMLHSSDQGSADVLAQVEGAASTVAAICQALLTALQEAAAKAATAAAKADGPSSLGDQVRVCMTAV